MNKISVLTACILIILVSFWSVLPTGCATIIPPSGGPRDSIPPMLLLADPPDSSVNFSGDRITLTFNEYIDLKNISENIFFTPTFEIPPGIRVRGRTIVIPFTEVTPEPNTTYVINFNNAIVDVNESNVLAGYSYAFSTGPVLDSLEISGRVILAETGGTDSTILVYLHRDLSDSAVALKKAPYVTNLDRDGYFNFKFLPSTTFAIYAIGGSGKDRRYNDQKTLFAFADDPVIAGVTDSIVLYAYNTPAPPKNQTPTRIPATDSLLKYTTNITGEQDLSKDLIINFPVPVQTFDSSRISLFTDSVYNPADFTTTLDTSGTMLTIQTEWLDSTLYSLVLNIGFATDTAGRQLFQPDTISFFTKRRTDYGNVSIRLRDLDLDRNPVLQFVQNNTVVFSVPMTSETYTQDLIIPGEYNLRILYDKNGDGRWTPGNFMGEKRQPELVQPVERTIVVKADWNNEFEIDL